MTLRPFDPAEFSEMWLRGDLYAKMTAHFGLTYAQISYRRQRLGLPPRPGPKRFGYRPEVSALAEGPAAPLCPPPMPPHPFWTPAHDLAVLDTRGRLAELAALAAGLGRPQVEVICRWHRLRAA